MSVLSNIQVYGIENAVRVSKFPMAVDANKPTSEITDTVRKLGSAKPGSGHDVFLNGIIVQFDLTFTNKAWVEAERYNFLTFISSMSTMHRITKFDLNNQYIEYVDPLMIRRMKELIEEYNCIDDEEDRKEQYLKILYSNPCGFKLTAGMTTNYRQLKTIVMQRENHRLPEWREFCKDIRQLPHFEELCFGNTEEGGGTRV